MDAIPLSSGERHTLEDEGYPVLLEVGKVVPEIPLAVLVAGKQFAAKEPELVARFIRALGKSMQLIKSNKEKAIQLAVAAKASRQSGDAAQSPRLFRPRPRRGNRTRKHHRAADGIGYQRRARSFLRSLLSIPRNGKAIAREQIIHSFFKS